MKSTLEAIRKQLVTKAKPMGRGLRLQQSPVYWESRSGMHETMGFATSTSTFLAVPTKEFGWKIDEDSAMGKGQRGEHKGSRRNGTSAEITKRRKQSLRISALSSASVSFSRSKPSPPSSSSSSCEVNRHGSGVLSCRSLARENKILRISGSDGLDRLDGLALTVDKLSFRER